MARHVKSVFPLRSRAADAVHRADSHVHADDWALGDHASYFLDPHGNTIECTTDLEVLDEDTWHLSFYDISTVENEDQRGTVDPIDEVLAKEGFNDVVRGPFVAPPV